MLSYVNRFLLSVLQNREAQISPQWGSVSLTGQKLDTVLCRRSHTLVIWEEALEIMAS